MEVIGTIVAELAWAAIQVALEMALTWPFRDRRRGW